MRIRSLASALCFCLAAPASAEVPRVVTDFSVTASLVGLVMGEVGAPIVLLDPGADPHDYQLRPSQASAIAAADLVVWMGPELTPWLPGALDSTGETHRMALLESPGTTLRRFGAAAEDAAQASSDAPAEGGHGDTDPHAWFDPDNGALWVGLIADRLADLDPEHASTYRANASLAQTRIAALDKSIGAEFSSRPPLPFAVGHDAFGYFADRYGLVVAGAITQGDAAAPGARHLAALRAGLQSGAIACLFPEAGADPKQAGLLVEGTPARLGAALDAEGRMTPAGPMLYETLLQQVADTIATCRSGS